MIKKTMSIIVFTTLFLLAGCGNGSEFLGKWQNVKKKSDAIEIVRNGSDFLLLKNSRDLMTGKLETGKIPLQYKDNSLKLDAGFMGATLSHMKSNDALYLVSIMGTEEYKRVNRGE
ncbi:MAG: hypothetical protein Q7T42_03230 [Methylotenera sp.]|uniref:hypothetical protein n=1 Tax=Methylotenera sp. TaxID=2051956 RepID=UPI00271D875E|nr:hypothetical protein [Methylotenera sp.]MDO9392972.1 hypothetical protein [Methylotenera sp.]